MKRKLHVLAVFALVAMVALSGCINGEDAETDAIDFVPDEADGVFHLDMAILEDEVTEDIGDRLIELAQEEDPDYDGPESYDEIWDELMEEEDIDLDPRELNEVVVFGSTPEDSIEMQAEEDEYAAAVFTAGWTEDEIIEQIEEEGTVEAGEYNGLPFYTIEPEEEVEEPGYMAVLNEETYSVGEEQAVRDTIDVAQGDADALSGELREELDRIRDGYVNFVFEVPDADLPDDADGQFDVGAFEEISIVSGSYYTEDDTMGMAVNMRTGSEQDAEDIQEAIDGIIAIGTLTFGEEVDDLLEPLEVEREDTTVMVSYETTVDELIERIEALEDAMPAPGAPPGETAPPGEFEDDFEDEFDDDFDDSFDEPENGF